MGMRAIVGFAFISLCACARRHPIPNVPPDVVEYHREAWRQFNKAVSSFSVTDGIDHSEAELLAQAFFLWKIGGCGFAESPEDAGAEWRSRPRVGIAGQPSSDFIRINKQTGLISHASEPPIAAQSVIGHERERLRDNLRTYVGEVGGGG
jgi:hypothetical protein